LPERSVEPAPPLRVGIINIMPKVETYESYLLAPLREASVAIETVWIRLETHAYSSSDADHIRSRYVSFEQAQGARPLDGLILTGAPVEELRFEAVHYWPELSAILRAARSRVKSTLGICWGGLALAQLLGIPKLTYPRKLFGVFRNRPLVPRHPLLDRSQAPFWCAHSRHSGVADDELERAERAGSVNLLSHGAETGYSIFESTDQRYVAHLGHPEYEPERLVHEWQRDRALARADVEAPKNFDPERPMHVWRSHRQQLFSRWLGYLATSSLL
jgi:homoserine O-succinyltransferase/O-acetyltransferase